MQNCIVIINKNAGSSKKISFEKVEQCLGRDYRYTRCTIPGDELPDFDGFDAVAVCGGHGTLSSILEKIYAKPVTVFYFPVGTLNDKAKAQRYSHLKTNCPSNDKKDGAKPIVVGKCYPAPNAANGQEKAEGEKTDFEQKGKSTTEWQKTDGQSEREKDSTVFSYVFAAGSFTPIGYTSDVKEKQRFGTLAYISKVVKEYRPHRIKAKIVCDDKEFEGEFSLIMFVKSPRCFGFPFNKDFDAESESGHLLAIRSPKHKGALGYIEMFFPFFRAFFIGLKKEREDGTLIFKRVRQGRIELAQSANFCKDGEKFTLNEGVHSIGFEHTKCDFCVIEKF